jgi:hypothetical protein
MNEQLSQYSGNSNCNPNYNASYQRDITALFYGRVTFFVLWIINMVTIGIVTRRRGLNPAVYVALAFFCGVFARICVACSQPRQQVVVMTSGAPWAPNSYPAPNPYGQQPAPNPYGQPHALPFVYNGHGGDTRE